MRFTITDKLSYLFELTFAHLRRSMKYHHSAISVGIALLTHFLPLVSCCSPWKHWKDRDFFCIFRGCRKKLVAQNRLVDPCQIMIFAHLNEEIDPVVDVSLIRYNRLLVNSKCFCIFSEHSYSVLSHLETVSSKNIDYFYFKNVYLPKSLILVNQARN